MSINKNTNSLISLSPNKQGKVKQFINDWERSFRDKIKNKTGSRKTVFTLKDAIAISEDFQTNFDKVMIEFHLFLETNPLSNNGFFKYLDSYKKGKKLKDKFFRHDLDELNKYYKKIDDNPQSFSFLKEKWESYVLFMMLKFNNVYKADEMDDIFNVKIIDNREYNPLTTIAKPMRALLPESLHLVEYDIRRAYPTFIDMELGIERKTDIYKIIDKKEFNKLVNSHKDIKDADINKIRKALEPIYKDKVNQVVTEKRFNNKGKMFRDFAKYENKYIHEFIEANNISRYVRLHDAVYVLSGTKVEKLKFDRVEFKESKIKPPEVINDKKMFYKIGNNGKVYTTPVSYKAFFIQEKFIRVTEENNDNLIILKDTNNVLEPFNYKTDTVSYLADQINEYDTSKVENQTAKDNKSKLRESFLLMKPKPLQYYRDETKSFGLGFKNGFWKIDQPYDKFTKLDYKQVKGFFAKHITQSKNFKPLLDYNMSDFERFITMVSVNVDPLKEELNHEQRSLQQKFFSMIGYLCHAKKISSFNPAIIITDEGADNENRNGGRGKSLFIKAMSHVQNTIIKGGDEFDPNYRHRFADLDESIKLFILDDVIANFNYDSLYTNITGDITNELKGITAKAISFDKAPKFLITTNWAVRKNKKAASTNRRFMEFKFTNYFGINHTPRDVFDKDLFEGWDDVEWNKFYNFIFSCVSEYLSNGLEAPEYDKSIDNYNAYFYNESVLEEFERVFGIVKQENNNTFKVNDFLKIYNSFDNPLKNEKYFHRNNVRDMIDTYLCKHKIDYKYVSNEKRWKIYDTSKTDNNISSEVVNSLSNDNLLN